MIYFSLHFEKTYISYRIMCFFFDLDFPPHPPGTVARHTLVCRTHNALQRPTRSYPSKVIPISSRLSYPSSLCPFWLLLVLVYFLVLTVLFWSAVCFVRPVPEKILVFV